MNFPRSHLYVSRAKAATLAILATLSAAANAPTADAGQLPWEQSPLAQVQPAGGMFQPALQPIPLGQPAFALAPQTSVAIPPAPMIPPQRVPQAITQLQHPTQMTGISNYAGTSGFLPGFSTARSIGEWNAIPQANAYGPLPTAPMENNLQMKEFLTNPALAEQLYAPMINPAVFDPATYFPNPNLEVPGELSGEVL